LISAAMHSGFTGLRRCGNAQRNVTAPRRF
jgi:hypothetical protein